MTPKELMKNESNIQLRMRIFILINMIVIIFTIISCEKDSNNTEPNTSPILVGDLIGDNLDHLSELWKVGEVLIESESEYYHIDEMYFMGRRINIFYIYYIF